MTERSPTPPDIENLATARFRCVFPVCGGICCRNGRPTVEEGERARLDANLEKLLPLLRPSAQAHIAKHGWLTNRVKGGLRTVAVEGGWCVFENGGCALQKAGMAEGEPWKYKPSVCIRFPLEQSARDGTWYVRQWGHRGEAWDLFCLNPAEDPTPAAESLKAEIAYVAKLGEQAQSGSG
jgi:hypothetical protein